MKVAIARPVLLLFFFSEGAGGGGGGGRGTTFLRLRNADCSIEIPNSSWLEVQVLLR